MEDKIAQLKARIAKLVHKKISKENSPNIENMAQPNATNAINAILGNRQTIATNLQGIRVYMDAGRIPIPPRIATYFDNIADNLDSITRHANTAHQGITRYRGLLDHANAQTRLVNQQLNDTRNQLIDINNNAQNIRNQMNTRIPMLEQALADERQVRQANDANNNDLRRSVHRYINDVGR